MLISMRMLATVMLVAAFFSSRPPVFAAPPHDNDYLENLIERASKESLANNRYWRVLLHYREDLFGGVTSEVDDPGFFLAPGGKTDPHAELRATLMAFFSDELMGPSRQPAQCAFVARYHWLKTRLSFDDDRLHSVQCDRFTQWFHELNAEAVTLIFPSAFMNNPASMFGHTLLRDLPPIFSHPES